MKRWPIAVMLSILSVSLVAGRAVHASLDRAPEILDHRQDAATNKIRLLWAPGGNADGTINTDVDSYAVEIKGDGYSSFSTIFTGDERAMTYVDPIGWASWGVSTWNPANQGAPVTYRVKATTSDGAISYSPEVAFVPALPLYPPNEVLDGKVELVWQPSVPRPPYNTHLGYRVQKRVPGQNLWIDAHVGLLSETTFIDSNPAIGINAYRVLSMYAPTGTGSLTSAVDRSGNLILTSNEQEVEINATCEGQVENPAIPSLSVLELTDRDADGAYTGNDIALALAACAAVQYERLDGPGDHDGLCEPGESCVTGGCVLRALPVTYENVAIKLTDRADFCDPTDDADGDAGPGNVTFPNHCLTLDLPAGLVIEGYGSRSVFRSPVWTPPYMPAPVFEVHRKTFPVTLRNVVLDGRKHEQQGPGMYTWDTWYHVGLLVWNQNPWQEGVVEVIGDSLGDGDGYCDFEDHPVSDTKLCNEAASGNDGDGKCEAGESCVDGLGGSCDAESWTNAEGCVSDPVWENSDGCVHNTEARNFFAGYAISIGAGKRWIVEDNRVHDIGCVNRGYGYDCPYLDSAADLGHPPGFKTYGIGLNFTDGTADFKVRRNEVYRATKYGISFKNGNASSCNMLTRNNEVADNKIHDIGAVGIFNHGSVGNRIHGNTIGRTTTWNEPQSMNSFEGPFGMSLGGFCSDDNEFYDNRVTDSAGMGIYWNGSADTVECTAPGVCTLVTAVGNTIRNNDVEGTCLEKDTAPGSTNTFMWGSYSASIDAAGPLYLIDNTLTNSQCRFSILSWGPRDASTGDLKMVVEGGSYESGPNAATEAEDGFYCGAVHVHGDNEKVVIRDDVHITNERGVAVPEASVGYTATLVIDDVPTPPFAPGEFSAPVSGDLGSQAIHCSVPPGDPDCTY